VSLNEIRNKGPVGNSTSS